MPLDEFRGTNLENWEDRVPLHAASHGYGLDRYRTDPEHISTIVEFDRDYVGDVRGARLLHLQCHIGTDTISWARLGAEATGVDFSPGALEVARALSDESRTPARFVQSELYEAPAALPGETFDVVYTGGGALSWLPDIAGWARVVAGFLAPGGLFYIKEGHPVFLALGDRDDGLLALEYAYFEGPAMRFEESSTYVDHDRPLTSTVTYEWNHGIGEIVTALLDAGLVIEGLVEHRFGEWPAINGMVEIGEGRWALPESLSDRVPLMYSLWARRP
ncbi:MAG TPA: class I SAM-dependent methyltransferase [Acidimicrobiia bacterium]|nr:class I SAM-dependent methyltransferase [Acidimicrobiia bacterium]